MAERQRDDAKQIVDRLERKLESVTGWIRVLYLIHGIGTFLVFAFGFFLVSFLIDYLIPDLPGLVRQIMFGAGGIGGAYVCWRVLVRPVFVTMDARDIALSVEDTYPELNDRLISALDLKASLDDENTSISRSLIQDLIQDLDELADQIRPTTILNLRPTLRRVGAGLLCTALFFVFAFQFQEETSVWFQRMMGGDTDWPRATILTLETDRKLKIVQGKSLPIRVSVDPSSTQVPSTAELHVSYNDGAEKTVSLNRSGDPSGRAVFQHSFENVRKGFEFVLEAGDNETSPGTVQVLPRPRIDHLLVRYDYPSYTGKKDTEDPIRQRQLTAPWDSEAIVQAPVPGTVKKARAWLDTGDEPEELPVEFRSTEAGTVLETVVPMRKNGDLYFEMALKSSVSFPDEPCTSAFGVCSSHFSIRTKVDLPPQVKVMYPGKNKFATPRAKIPIRTRTEDDFGVASVWFKQKVNDGSWSETDFTGEHNNRPYESKNIESEYVLDLSTLDVEKADRVFYAVAATDTGTRNEKPTTSRTFRFSIISVGRMEVKLQKIQQEVRDKLNGLRKDQSELIDHMSYHLDRLKEASKEKAMSAQTNSLLEQRRNKQRSLNQQMRRIVHELETLYRDATYNRLWDEKSRERLQSIYGLADAVSSNQMSDASQRIAKALNAVEYSSRIKFIRASQDLQKRALAKLDVLLNQMGKWLEYADIIHELKGIQERIKTLREDYLKEE